MQFNLDTFRQNGLALGGARPSLFAVRMTGVPVGVSTIFSQVEFLCQAASIPASRVDVVEVPYFGRRMRIAGERTFDDWTVTIMNDEDFAIRDMFEAWSDKINTMVSNRQNSAAGSLLDYKVDTVEVLQYGKVGPDSDAGVIRSYIFAGLFPTRIDQIPLDWSRGNDIERFDVTFAFDYWVPTTIGQSNPSYSGFLAPDTSNLGITNVPAASSGAVT